MKADTDRLKALTDLIDACEHYPQESNNYIALAILLGNQGENNFAKLLQQTAAIVHGFGGGKETSKPMSAAAIASDAAKLDLAKHARDGFIRALGFLTNDLPTPDERLIVDGKPTIENDLQPKLIPEMIIADEFAELVQQLHDALSAPSSEKALAELKNAVERLDAEFRYDNKKHNPSHLHMRITWVARQQLKAWFLEIRGLAVGPFGSAALLHATAHMPEIGLGPFLRNLRRLATTGHELISLAWLWSRDRAEPDRLMAFEQGCVLVAQIAEPALKREAVEVLGNFSLFRALSMIESIACTNGMKPDRQLLERIRDAYADGGHADWSFQAQSRIAGAWSTDINEQIVLGQIALAARRWSIAEYIFARALEIDPQNGTAIGRLKELASGRYPQVGIQGFGNSVELRQLRARLRQDPAKRMKALESLSQTAEAMLSGASKATNEIIKSSDRYWLDEAYYSSLGSMGDIMGRKKRKVRTIALYYWRLRDGGTERVTARLATIWKSMGYRVLLITDEAPTSHDYHVDPEIERRFIPPHRHRFAERGNALAKILRDENADVFVSNLWVETATSWDLFVAKSLDIPVIIGWHNVFDAGIYNGNDIEYFIKRLAAYRYADLVVALSTMDQYWFSLQGIASRVIHNPLTFAEMPAAIAPLSSKTIIWVGRVEQHQKRVEHVIRMMPIVLQQVPDALLIVVGDGPDRPMAESLVVALGISERVKFVGYSTEVETYIKQAAVHVMTSEFEGSPMAISETWSYGVPTVMYDLAFLEFLRGGKGHIAVAQEDYETLGLEVVRVLLDDELRFRLGREARETTQAFLAADIESLWRNTFDQLEINDNMALPLTDSAIVSVAPILVRHVVDRMRSVDKRASDERKHIEVRIKEIETSYKTNRNGKVSTQFAELAARLAERAIYFGAKAFDTIPNSKFTKLETIDFGHIGLGDNLMAWVGLHTLLLEGCEVVSSTCVMYVPNDLVGLARSVFSRFGLNIQGVKAHQNQTLISPVFSPLPPETADQWRKTYMGVDWMMNCFEALDKQKTIARPGTKDGPLTRVRLALSERILNKRRGWQDCEPQYIGYRLWLPIARRLGIHPLIFMGQMKRALVELRRDIGQYVDAYAQGKGQVPDIAIFPSGKSFQAFSPNSCQTIASRLPTSGTRFYIQSNDPWIEQYNAVGIDPYNLNTVEDLLWVVKFTPRLMTTDSFSSHVAQLLRDDFVLVLMRDFRENIVHPGANPLVVANHPPCAPCNYVPRTDSKTCVAGYRSCIAFDNPDFLSRITKLLLAIPVKVGPNTKT